MIGVIRPQKFAKIHDSLNKDQILMAQKFIEELHPIYKSKIEDAYPYICCCARIFRDKFTMENLEEMKNDLEASLLKNVNQRELPKESTTKEARKL